MSILAYFAELRRATTDAAQERVDSLNGAYHVDTSMCTCCEHRSTVCDCPSDAQWVDYGDHGLLLAVESLLCIDNEAAAALGRKFAQARRSALDALFLPKKEVSVS